MTHRYRQYNDDYYDQEQYPNYDYDYHQDYYYDQDATEYKDGDDSYYDDEIEEASLSPEEQYMEDRYFVEYSYPQEAYSSHYTAHDNSDYERQRKAADRELLRRPDDPVFRNNELIEYLAEKRSKKATLDYYKDIRNKTPHITLQSVKSVNIDAAYLTKSTEPRRYPITEPHPNKFLKSSPTPPPLPQQTAPSPPSNQFVETERAKNSDKTISEGSMRSRNRYYPSKYEKIKKFPMPEKKLPTVPLPDYENDATAEYIPEPDY